MSNQILWHITLDIEPEAAGAYEMVLEPLCVSLVHELDDDERPRRLLGFAEDRPDEAALKQTLAETARRLSLAEPALTVDSFENKDWLSEYARNHPPLEVGRFFIYGSTYEGDLPPGKIALKVEAATAFGTGEHASTKGCLMALEGLSNRYRFERPLDMGCGSAILAMGIAKIWGCRVVASDIDQGSVEVAAYNAQANGIGSYILPVCADGYGAPSVFRNGPYDLIMANILARPLSLMAKDLARNLESGGFCVLAGFLERDANWVFAAHRAHGLKLVRRIRVDGWQTLVLRKK